MYDTEKFHKKQPVRNTPTVVYKDPKHGLVKLEVPAVQARAFRNMRTHLGKMLDVDEWTPELQAQRDEERVREQQVKKLRRLLKAS